MRVAVLLGLLAAGSLAATPAPSSSRLPSVPLFGHAYAPLGEWARARGFTFRWVHGHKDLVLTSPWSRLEFSVDSRKAAINGVNVHLSFPIAGHDGRAFIAPLDLTTLVQPILYPRRQQPVRRIRVICLDPGHGGKDPGNQEAGHQEKRYTLLLARELRRQLVRAGLKVVLTRNTDRYVDLEARPALARQAGADLFVSLHFNSAKDPSVKGVEVYCLTPAHASSTNAHGEGADSGAFPGNAHDAQNVLLAYELQKAIVRGLPVDDRGLRRARFAMLRPARMPAVLIEGGFMTNPAEARTVYESSGRRELVQAIVDGLLAYKRLVER